jgi:cysteinyl-tRNA synthetase
VTLVEVTREAEERFASALDRRDATDMVTAVLDLESAIRDWSADTEEDEGTDLARDVLRGLITQLGEAATAGLRSPDDVARPIVEPMLALRDELRDQASYDTADRIRDVLTAAGVEVHDTEAGTTWTVVDRC